MAGGENIGGFKDKKVAVLMGGLSEEREISLKTGGAVLKALLGLGYRAVGIDAGRDLPGKLVEEGIEAVFIALHGRYGEDGCVQGVCEVMGLPYTGSGVRASSIAMDKAATKKVFLYHGISTPNFEILTGGAAVTVFDPPVVVKPAVQGSAIGVSIVKNTPDLELAITEAWKHSGAGEAVVVEDYVSGKELTVAILDDTVYPVVEIRPHRGFYDFEAKYTKGKTDFIVPAEIAGQLESRVVKESIDAYKAIGCRGAARVDVILGNDGRPYVLEVNTIPGLTEMSLFPKAAAAAGVGYAELVERMLEGAGVDRF